MVYGRIERSIGVVCLLGVTVGMTMVCGFSPQPQQRASVMSGSNSRVWSSRVSEWRDIQSNMMESVEGDEDVKLMMQALRGQNLNDDSQAMEGLEMQLVDVAVDEGTGLPLTYEPNTLATFFSQRPLVVIQRLAQVAFSGGGFFLKTALDVLFKRMTPELEIQRAGELRDLITSLGPFYIKLGQALSIRPDVLSPRSMVELQKLCDKVPSYPTKIAFATIERELGKTVDQIFSEITPEPVAAASLGQVYKATLRDTGEIVAVKVQRPGVLETVSLDLYLARQIGLFARNIPSLVERLDAVELLDEFAFRFYQELDYVVECQNGIKMKEQMKILPNVVIPGNFPQYTSRRVHVAEWVDGEKLSQCTANDVGALVNLGVITYLTQLLEYGYLHSDPHPGNMLRTTDGKLCILDFGLMTDITDNQKYGMIEAIAHLINRDYDEIGQDFINLEFIPQGTDTKPIVPALKKVFDVALAGGGAKSINFQELAAELAQITYDYPFSIPAYFALIIRAISVLEGIALVGNPNFAIIDEAYPYIARKLMTDDSPRLKKALRYMVYGKEGRTLDAENLIDLLQALEKFTAVRDDGDGSAFKVDGMRGAKFVGKAGDVKGSQAVDISDRNTEVGDGRFKLDPQQHKEPLTTGAATSITTSTEQDETTVREALRFFFSPEGQVFRDFLLEEVVTVVDASSREAILELTKSLGPLSNVIPINSSLFRAFVPELSDDDKQMVTQIQKLVQFLLGDFEGASAGSSDRLRALLPVLREYAPQLRDFGSLLLVRLSEKSLSRTLNWASSRLIPQPALR